MTFALAAITAVALLVRLLHFTAIERTAFPDLPTVFVNSDMHAFLSWAEKIQAGDLLGRDTYHPYNDWMQAIAPLETWQRWWGGREIFQEAPLYPYFVASMLAVSGHSLRFVLFVQLVLGALRPLVVFALARRLFDARAALFAAALAALYGPFVFYEGTLLRDWLPPILEPLALVLLLRAHATTRGADWALAGAVMGVAFLVKESILLFLPIAVLWAVWESRRRLATALGPAGWVLAGFLVAVSPLVVRNALVGAPLLAASNRAAEGLIIGNVADSYPVASFFPSSLGGILERTDGHLLAVVRETLATYHGDWSALLGKALLKARALLDPIEVPNNLSFQYGLEISPILHATLRWGAILPLGLAGFVLVGDRWRRHLLLFLYALTGVAGLLLTGVVGRYRLPLVPVLAVYAGAGAARALDALRDRRVAPAVALALLVLAVTAVQQLVVPIPRLREDPQASIYTPEYKLSANLYVQQGQWNRAVDEMTRLRLMVEAHPAPLEDRQRAAVEEGNYRAGWVQELLKQDRREEARRQAEEVGRLYASIPDASETHYALGTLYLAVGDLPGARAEFEHFLTMDPHGPAADGVRALLARPPGAP